jgi:glycosyltransferase involved in cell wall biosynthesis
MIEAMARALPCIGSSVGGIPELLPPEDIVPPGDLSALASKITQVLQQPVRMQQMSARNVIKAGEYRDEVLSDRRREFYQFLKVRMQAWLDQNQCIK